MVIVIVLIIYLKPKKNPMYIPESKRVTKPIDPKKYYTDDEAIKLAQEMKGVTLLRTNEGRVYINSQMRHVEIVFIEDTPNPRFITGLWITNSPCSDCAQCLMTYFKSCHTKPDIFIGKIYQQQKKHDGEGLQDLMKEGFKIQVWESFQQDRQTVREIRNYLLHVRLSKKRMSPYTT